MSATATLQKTTKQLYQEALVEICKAHGIKNKMAAPRIDKVCLNMGVGRAVQDGQILNVVSEHLSLLAGQRCAITKAKKAVANFRSRIGVKLGARVTLRGDRMWSFLDKLEHNQGLNITICISNSDPKKSYDLLKLINMPFREQTAAAAKN